MPAGTGLKGRVTSICPHYMWQVNHVKPIPLILLGRRSSCTYTQPSNFNTAVYDLKRVPTFLEIVKAIQVLSTNVLILSM